MSVIVIRRHAPAAHTSTCPGTAHSGACGRPVVWHVDVGPMGCGNYCGIHARVLQRQSLWSAIFGKPIINGRRAR